MVWVVKAELKGAYTVYVEFNDGVSGVINFKEELENDHLEIFRELLDLKLFNTVRLDCDTLCWDNEADFAPEYLYELVATQKQAAMQKQIA